VEDLEQPGGKSGTSLWRNYSLSHLLMGVDGFVVVEIFKDISIILIYI
jgi:hypothetical protein